MTHDPSAAAMQRYHDRFNSHLYNSVTELLASNLNAERDDPAVADLLVNLQDAALELCGHPEHGGAWHTLAVQCGRSFLSVHTVDAIWQFLQAFSADDTRLDDFEATAKALLRVYSALDDLRTATAHANGAHSWQGRAAYDLLAAVELLTHGAITLLAHDDEAYTREKLHAGLNRLTGALYEGIRHSHQPALYNFRSTYFPTEHDRR